MNVGGLIGGVVAGAIGAAVWCAVAHYANLEIGYLAWGIGALVGFAVAVGGRTPGPAAGVMAVIITVLAIVAGKYASVEILIQKELAVVFGEDGNVAAEEMEEPALIANLARGIVSQRESEGQVIQWPEVDEDDEDVTAEESFPADIWTEATAQWGAMDDADKDVHRVKTAEETKAMFEEFQGAILGQARQGAFLASFGVMDLLFFGLAIATSWGIAVNGGMEE